MPTLMALGLVAATSTSKDRRVVAASNRADSWGPRLSMRGASVFPSNLRDTIGPSKGVRRACNAVDLTVYSTASREHGRTS